MNFSKQTTAWIKLICLVITAGGGAGLNSFLGGCSLPVSIVTGLITAATGVGLALSKSPNDHKPSP